MFKRNLHFMSFVYQLKHLRTLVLNFLVMFYFAVLLFIHGFLFDFAVVSSALVSVTSLPSSQPRSFIPCWFVSICCWFWSLCLPDFLNPYLDLYLHLTISNCYY